jgi:DNA-binding MarR family transcriptional regulator
MHTSNIVAAWAFALSDQLREEMRRLGLEQRDVEALTLVNTHDGSSVDWLRERLGLTHSGTVRLVDRLAQRELLVRGQTGGRTVPLHVTPAGKRLLRRWAHGRDRVVADVLGGLPETSRDVLVPAMSAVLQGTPRSRAQADATCRTCTWSACGRDCPVNLSVPLTAP